MKLKSLLLTTAIVGALASAPVLAVPSAKFAAVYSDNTALTTIAVLTDEDVDKGLNASRNGYTMATIKVPQNKELLVGLSAEIALLTDTSAKGKNGGTAKVSAGSSGTVQLVAIPHSGGAPIPALPGGPVTLSSRFQEITTTLAGVIQECTLDVSGTINVISDTFSGTGSFDVADDCVVTDEQIGLLQDTTAAHHYNFVFADMPSDTYDIKALFTTGANVSVDICESDEACLYDEDGTITGSAKAIAAIDSYMLTVQEVRAVKGQIGILDITETSSSCTGDDAQWVLVGDVYECQSVPD